MKGLLLRGCELGFPADLAAAWQAQLLTQESDDRRAVAEKREPNLSGQ